MKKLLIGLAGLCAVGCGVVLADDPDTVTREAQRVQVDTNATTVATHYTASKAGSVLVGKGGGSNVVWIATAAGTNGWVVIAQKL